jgi:hypothetical protein
LIRVLAPLPDQHIALPIFDFSINTATIDTLELISRVAQIVEGREQWDEAWERLEASSDQQRLDLDEERNSPKLPRLHVNFSPGHGSVGRAILPRTSSHPNRMDHLAEDLLERLQFYESR